MPPCPRCSRPLSRQVSLFQAKLGSGLDRDPWGLANDGCDDDTAGAPDFDPGDERIARAVDELGSKIDKMDDTDTAGAAKLMQEFAQKSGVKFNKDVNEALGRLAAGEDADAVSAQLGDALDSENPFDTSGGTGRSGAARPHPFDRDPTLYDM